MKNIRISNSIIETLLETKYLGVTFDSRVTWKRHMDQAISKATRSLMISRRIAGKIQGCTSKIIRWIYTRIVKTVITYGAITWSERVKLNSAITALAKLQRRACACITGYNKTCSTVALKGLFDLRPLHEVIQLSQKKNRLKIMEDEKGKGKIVTSKKKQQK